MAVLLFGLLVTQIITQPLNWPGHQVDGRFLARHTRHGESQTFDVKRQETDFELRISAS